MKKLKEIGWICLMCKEVCPCRNCEKLAANDILKLKNEISSEKEIAKKSRENDDSEKEDNYDEDNSLNKKAIQIDNFIIYEGSFDDKCEKLKKKKANYIPVKKKIVKKIEKSLGYQKQHKKHTWKEKISPKHLNEQKKRGKDKDNSPKIYNEPDPQMRVPVFSQPQGPMPMSFAQFASSPLFTNPQSQYQGMNMAYYPSYYGYPPGSSIYIQPSQQNYNQLNFLQQYFYPCQPGSNGYAMAPFPYYPMQQQKFYEMPQQQDSLNQNVMSFLH
jgi:hypothetical protein